MKRFYFLINIWIVSVLAFSQIGINTEAPLALFHVDGASDNNNSATPTSPQAANDVLISKSGQVRIGGTSIDNAFPNVRLHISEKKLGVIRYNYGNLANATGKVLTSDENGNAFWGGFSDLHVARWNLKVDNSSTLSFSDNVPTNLKGTTSLPADNDVNVNISIDQPNLVTVPAGRYLIFSTCSFDQSVNENGYFSVRDATHGDKELFSAFYTYNLNGAAFYFTATETSRLSVWFTPIDDSLLKNANWLTSSSNYGAASINASLLFMKI